MRKGLVLRKYKRNFLSIILCLLFSLFVVITMEQVVSADTEFVNSETEEIRSKINDAFNRAGIFDGYVQYNEKLKMFEVMGKFRTYDEFLYAYMIAQAYAGVTKVSPAYSIKHAVIIHTPIERCLPYVIIGKECPHIKKEKIEHTEYGAKIRAEIKGKNKIALVLGVSVFANNIPPIVGADNDGLLWGKYLENMGYKVFYLLNENATKQRVLETLEAIIENLKDGDTFVFVASSHGTPKNERGEVGIVLYDSGDLMRNRCAQLVPNEPHLQAAEKMCVLVKDSLSVERDILEKLRGKKITFIPILDACYSGDALRGYIGDVIKPEEVAPLDFYENRLRVMAPKSLGVFVSSSSGFRMSYSVGDVRALSIVRDNEEIVAVTEKGVKKLEKTDFEKQDILPQDIRFKPYSHGIFSFVVVNSLSKFKNEIVRTLDGTKDIINKESKKSCELTSSGKGIRIVRRCPEDGQQPIVLRVNLNEFAF